MSDKDFVFQLGPLQGGAGAGYLYFVYPGQPDNYTFPASDDEAAWLRITEDYDPATLACEPALDGPAKPEGVTPEPYDRYTAHALAMMTYAHLPGDPLLALRTEGLISDLVRASGSYLRSDYAGGRAGAGTLAARFEGDPDIRTSARVIDGGDRRRNLRLVFDDLTEEKSGEPIAFGVEFRDGPAFAIDAMRRGFGLDTLPVPWVGTDAEPGKPNDMILLLLIAALTALAHLKHGGSGAHGRYAIGGMQIACRID